MINVSKSLIRIRKVDKKKNNKIVVNRLFRTKINWRDANAQTFASRKRRPRDRRTLVTQTRSYYYFIMIIKGVYIRREGDREHTNTRGQRWRERVELLLSSHTVVGRRRKSGKKIVRKKKNPFVAFGGLAAVIILTGGPAAQTRRRRVVGGFGCKTDQI